MFVKQLSVFIENRTGRLEQVTEVLMEEDINIVSVSLADTNEYGLLRMIVSNPEKAKKALHQKGFSAILTDVLAVKLNNEVAALQNLLQLLSQAGLNVEYMYVLDSTKANGSMIVKVSEPDKALEAVHKGNLEVFDAESAYTIHD